MTRSDEETSAISRAEAALKDARDDLHKWRDAHAATTTRLIDAVSDAEKSHERAKAELCELELKQAEKNRARAEAELCELELKLLKSSDFFRKKGYLEQFRAVYARREQVDLVELGSSARPGDISNVRATRAR